MENNFSHRLLNDAGLRVGNDRLEIDVRLPWYRSLPLSVVDVFALSVDGRAVEKERMRFRINDKSLALDDLKDQVEEFWFVLDPAVIEVRMPVTGADAPHEIELQLDLYPPYIPHLRWVTRAKRSLRPQRLSARDT